MSQAEVFTDEVMFYSCYVQARFPTSFLSLWLSPESYSSKGSNEMTGFFGSEHLRQFKYTYTHTHTPHAGSWIPPFECKNAAHYTFKSIGYAQLAENHPRVILDGAWINKILLYEAHIHCGGFVNVWCKALQLWAKERLWHAAIFLWF